MILVAILSFYCGAAYIGGLNAFIANDGGIGSWIAWLFSPIIIPLYLLLCIITAAVGWSK